MRRVVVWGTGNVGRPAIRAVQGHKDLQLAGVIVNDSAKVGVDAGTLARMDTTIGVVATTTRGSPPQVTSTPSCTA